MKARIFLVGGFEKTKYLANSLIKQGFEVTAINKDKEKCLQLAEIDKLEVYCGDGSKTFVLEEAGIYNAEMAISLSDRDDDNLVICGLCKKKYNVKKTVALITDPKKIDFFHRMGIDSVVCAVSTIASLIERHALFDEISAMISIDESQVKISQVHITGAAPAINKRIRDLNLPKQVTVGCILRGEKNFVPRGDSRIHADDVLVLLSSIEHETAAVRELTGR